MRKEYWVAVLVVLSIAVYGIVLASQPCDDLSDCGQAAEDYCEQIEGSTATSSEIIVEVNGRSACQMCCANGTCQTLRCVGNNQ